MALGADRPAGASQCIDFAIRKVWAAPVLALVWLLLLWAVYSHGLDKASHWAAENAPHWIEQRIGESVIKTVTKRAPVFDMRDTDSLAKRLALIDRLQKMAKQAGLPPLRVHWMRGPVNAYAAPGSVLIFTDKALSELTLDELVAVGAHEIGHLVHRHSLRHLLRSVGTSVVADMVLGPGYAGVLGDKVLAQLSNLQNSRDAERQADATAHQLLRAAGYSPMQLANAFRSLKKQPGSAGAAIWLSTHPDTDERIEAAEKASR